MQLFITRFKEMYYKTQMKETGFRYIFPDLSVLSFLAVCLSVCDYFPLNYCDVMREKGVKINVNTFLKFSLSLQNLMIERKIQG